MIKLPLPRSRRARRATSATSLGVAVSMLVALAVTADGSPVTDVELHDGSVWVTNADHPTGPLVGRLNPQIGKLDLGISADSAELDVFQKDSTVLIDSQAGARGLRVVDVANGAAGEPVELPETYRASFGGGVVGLLDSATGTAWVVRSDQVSAFSGEVPEATKVGRDGAIAVSPTGVAYVLDRARGEVRAFSIDPVGAVSADAVHELGKGIGPDPQLTVVGDRPAAYDPESGLLYRAGADPVRVETDEPGLARIQQPSVASKTLHVATIEGVFSTGTDSGDLTQLKSPPVSGAPAAPLVVGGCVHTAWADPEAEASYSRWCTGGEPELHEAIPNVGAGADLVFRTNRNVVVLNDTRSGDSWVVRRDQLDQVDNWDDVDPKRKKEELEKVERDDPLDGRNRPPKANNDDDFGARPGQATTLPVVANDTDPDRDILTIGKVTHISGPRPEGGYAVVGNATQVQARYPLNASGTARFTYEINDGHGHADSAEVSVAIGASGNEAPKRLEDRDVTPLSVAADGRNSMFVLADWFDPDGDDLIVVAATAKDEGGTVEFRPDGTVEYIDTSGTARSTSIEVTIADGRGGESVTTVPVRITDPSEAAPTLTPDRFAGTVGETVLIDPLRNDGNPLGGPLTLTEVRAAGGTDGLTIGRDFADGTATATASRPDTYYLTYKAVNDNRTSESYIRLDIRAAQNTNRPPIAVKDQAALPVGGSALVDVLANDLDADDDVLVVQSLDIPPDAPVKAALLERRLLRIEATGDLTEPVTIAYTVSDGEASSIGQVLVSPVEARESNRAPVVNDDRATVRVGAVTTIDVLANDSDPDGDVLTLHHEDLDVSDDLENAGLLVFVSGNRLKLRAPADPGQYSFGYTVRDARETRVGGVVRLTVKPDDPQGNSAPAPRPIIDRTVEGESVRVAIDAQGSDPDGDAVVIRGIAVAPSQGRIRSTGVDWLEYEPFEGSAGTDIFSVVVQDKYGGTGRAEVRIGVVPRPRVNQAPVAFDDELLVKPGKQIQFDVRANDSDPDGDAFTVLADKDRLTAPDGVDVEVVDGRFVMLTAPDPQGDEVASRTVGYTITDNLGGHDTAFFTLKASRTAPLHAPIVVDDASDLAEVTGKVAGDTVEVDVLDNDGDLDGRVEDLKLTALDTDVSRIVDGKLEVTLAEADQVVAYRVSDKDDQEGFGFVYITGTASAPPVINPDTVPVKATMNEPLEIDLASHVLVRAGRKPTLTTTDKISAHNDDGSELTVEGKNAVLRFSPRKDYVGPASITFEVTDGKGADDDDVQTALLTLPIDVAPDGNLAPTTRDVALTVAEGGEETTELDLAKAATDPNDDKLTFAADSGDKVNVKIDGTVLKLTAKGTARRGDTEILDVKVSDGEFTVPMQVHVRVSSTTRPLITIAPIELDGQAGEPLTFDVAAYATNPYPGKPLTVSGAAVESGQATASSAEGSKVTVTPKADTAGLVSVRFVVKDDSGDVTREVVGRATIAVVGRPEAPGRPTTSAVEANSVVLSWSAPDDRGAPILEYEVTGSHGFSQSCRSTSCQLTGLTPGNEYTWTVRARNRARENGGWSDASQASQPVTPDQMPDIMAPPVITENPTDMDRKLTLTWAPPRNVGSPIEAYEIKLAGTGEAQRVGPGDRSYTWANLTNGTKYQFQIRAVNKTPESQEFSPASSAVHPFGTPGTMRPPVAEAPNNGAGGGKTIRVVWEAPDDNGDPISGYRVAISKNGEKDWLVEEVPAGTTAKTYTVDANGVDYRFFIRPKNRAGWAVDSSGPSNTVNPYGTAKEATGLTLVTDKDKKATIRFTNPSDSGGRAISHYTVSGGANGNCTPSTKTAGAVATCDVPFPANQKYTIRLTTVTSKNAATDGGAGSITGAQSAALAVSPYGAVGTPSVTAKASGTNIAYTWTLPAPNGRPITARYRLDGGSWVTVTKSGSTTKSYDYSTTGKIEIEVSTAESGTNQKKTATATAKTAAKPAPQVIVKKGDPISPGDSKRYVEITLLDFPPNSTQYLDIALGNDSDWCGNTANCVDPYPLKVNPYGNGHIYTYYYNGYCGTVHVYVGSRHGSVKWC